jgi:hypothetical protein
MACGVCATERMGQADPKMPAVLAFPHSTSFSRRRADDVGLAANPAAADNPNGEGHYRYRNRKGGGLFNWFRLEASDGDQGG